MNQTDVIRMIGDTLTEVDVLIGSLVPPDPNLTTLQDLRHLLDARQLVLSRQIFNANTERFQRAAAELKEVNDGIRTSIQQIDDMVTVIENLSRLLDSVTTFLRVIGGDI